MFSSSPKRRKTSPTTAVPADASNTNQRPGSRDSRQSPPKRASFQSPTKASISRSHPNVLSRVLSRSPEKTARKRSGSGIGDNGRPNSSDSRSFGLRDRKALRPSLSGAEDDSLETVRSSTGDYRRREYSTGFVAPPRRLSRPSAERSSRQASEAREESARHSSPRSRNVEDQSSGSPHQSESNPAADSAQLPEIENGDPDLPPTPTELGLQPRPVRPRGLLSSSPSSRKEKRNRKQRPGFSPSPLKPRPKKYIGDQAPKEPPSRDNGQVLERVPDAVRTARKLRDELSAQLGRLKNDIAVLENETERNQRPNDYPVPNRAAIEQLISILTTTNPSCAPPSELPTRPPISSVLATLLPFSSARESSLTQSSQTSSPSPPPNGHFKLDEPTNILPYLQIFAPLSLDTHTTSSKPSISNDSSTASLTQTHTLTLSAPPPFSPHSYRVPVRLHTDPESQSILSISILNDKFNTENGSGSSAVPNIPAPLLNWLKSRLKNPLLQYDVSGLCWGICRYWEAKVSRARIWAVLSAKFRRIILGGLDSRPWTSTDTASGGIGGHQENEITNHRSLLPHLERTSMVFSSPDGKTRPETRLLLSCSLSLDNWTSEPELHLDICISRSPTASSGSGAGYARVERESKKLFQSLLTWNEGGEGPDASSIIRAVEGVLGVVFGTEGIEGEDGGKVTKGLNRVTQGR